MEDRPWHAFAAQLRGFVATRVPAQDVDDVTQDVMLRIHKGLGSLRESHRAESWVYGIARRAIADYFRERGRRLRRETDLDSGDPAGPLPGPDAHEEVIGWMRPFAESLPDGYREALLMADFEGRTQRDVATRLGLSLSGAKSRVQRARRMLGEQLRACCELHFGTDGRVTDYERRACRC